MMGQEVTRLVRDLSVVRERGSRLMMQSRVRGVVLQELRILMIHHSIVDRGTVDLRAIGIVHDMALVERRMGLIADAVVSQMLNIARMNQVLRTDISHMVLDAEIVL